MAALHVFLDEAHFPQSAPLWMVAAAVVPRVRQGEKQLVQLFDSLVGQANQFDSPRRFSDFQRRGFHFTENNGVVRDAWVQAASAIGYRVHLCFSRNPWKVEDPVLYSAMYSRLVTPIMRRYRDKRQVYVFEQHSEMNRVFEQLVSRAARSCELDPARMNVYIGEKADPLLSVPDYVMGAFARAIVEDGAEFEKRTARALALSLAHAMDFDKALHSRRGRAVL